MSDQPATIRRKFDGRTEDRLAADEPDIIDRSDHEPRIRMASRQCAEGLDKLAVLIAQLEERLDVVRLRGGSEMHDEQDLPVAKASMLAMDLDSYKESILRLQRRIGDLLEELEI